MFGATATEETTATVERTEFEEETSRLMDLRSQHTGLDRKIGELNHSGTSVDTDYLDQQAIAILGGSEIKIVTDETKARTREELLQRRAAVGRAIKMQEGIVGRLATERSKTKSEAARDEHAAIVAEMCEALVSLTKAADRERGLREGLDADGVNHSGYIRAMQYKNSTFTELSSNAGLFLREALQYDLVTAKQLMAMGVPSQLLAHIRAVTGK